MKIYKKGNYIVFDSVNGVMKLEHANQVMVSKSTIDSNEFTFASDDLGIIKVLFSDIENENGDAYGSVSLFNDFILDSTGFKTTSGGSEVQYIGSLFGFPVAVNGVITLKENTTYIITKEVDLLGNRLVAGGVCNLFGLSSETSFLKSTGLGVGVPLLTSIYTIVLEKISFHDVDTCISIDGNTNLVALDWKAVNFINIPNVGVINSCDNFIFDTGSFLGSQGLRFTGSIGTVALNNSLFRGIGSAGNILELDASCVITRRFRVIYSSVVAFGSTVGVNVNSSATIPIEAYILDTVNFSGGSTYLSGVTSTDNKTLFINCVGITNTAVNGQMYMQDNSTETTIANTDDFVKVAGTTTASDDNSKYTMTDNRLTNNAIIQRKYLLTCTLSFDAGANNVCQFGFYDSKLGGMREPSKTKATANAGGRAENLTMSCVVNHSDTNYIEIHVRNTSATTNVTVTDMNVMITEIK